MFKRKRYTRKDRAYLKQYFKTKRNEPVIDIELDTYYSRLRKWDVDVLTLNVSIDKYDLRVRLVYVGSYGIHPNEVGFEVNGLIGEKDIFQCEDYKEFEDLYGDVLLFLEKNFENIRTGEIMMHRYYRDS